MRHVQQTLHDQLVGALRRRREDGLSHQACVPRVGSVQVPREGECPQLADSRGLEQGSPSARHGQTNGGDRHAGPEQVQPYLDRIHPYDGPDAAATCEFGRQHSSHRDRDAVRPVGDQRERDGRYEEAYRIGKKARHHEDCRRVPPGTKAESRFDQSIGGGQVSPVVRREEYQGYEDEADQVAQCHLQEDEPAHLHNPGNA